MSINLSVKLNGIDKILSNFRRARQESGRAYADAINKTILTSERQVKLNTPVGVSGGLRSSITTDQANENKLSGAVGTNLQYAPYVENDTSPHFPPLAPLKLWAQRKLGNAALAFAIARKIARSGTKGKKMFEQAAKYIDDNKIHRQNLEEAAKKVAQTGKG